MRAREDFPDLKQTTGYAREAATHSQVDGLVSAANPSLDSSEQAGGAMCVVKCMRKGNHYATTCMSKLRVEEDYLFVARNGVLQLAGGDGRRQTASEVVERDGRSSRCGHVREW